MYFKIDSDEGAKDSKNGEDPAYGGKVLRVEAVPCGGREALEANGAAGRTRTDNGENPSGF